MNIQVSKSANSVQEYYFSKKLKEIKQMQEAGIDIINMGIGDPDSAPPKIVTDTLQDYSNDSTHHGYQAYKGIPELRQAFSKWYEQYFATKTDPEKEILPLSGSKSGIMYISTAFLNEGDLVLVPNPGYPAYAAAAKINGAIPVHFSLDKNNGYFPDLDALNRHDLSNVKLMWVNYPNMPTGQKASTEQFESLIEFGKKNNILIINDNPYSFILNDDQLSILRIRGAFDTAMELNSLSKSHNMAGWRIGVLLGREDYIHSVQKIQSNITSGMFLPIQKAAVKALEIGREWYEALNIIYKKRQKAAQLLLNRLACNFREEQSGMFLWAEIPSSFSDAYNFSNDILQRHKLFIAPGGIFGSNGKRYIRISLCNNLETFDKAFDRLLQRSSN